MKNAFYHINHWIKRSLYFFSLVKFSHTIFALPFAFVGFFMAILLYDYAFNWKIFLLVVLCMIFARNAAMGFNRFVDRNFDFQNPRTRKREIPQQKISEKAAFTFIVINALLFMLTAFFINMLTFFLSPVALFVILGYSYTKRFTALSHFFLGLGLALAPLGAFIAVSASFHLLPILLSILVFLWSSGFDVIYALQDIDFDRKANLKSIPAFLGGRRALFFSTLIHILTAITMIVIGISGNFSLFFWIGASVFIILLFYQHLIISEKNLSKINIAFFTTNGFASIIFALFAIADMWCAH